MGRSDLYKKEENGTMQQIQLELEGGGTLTVCLRASLDAMPTVKQRPLVLVVPGGGYSHVSPR